MRVLHAPVNIGNQPWNLSRAERRLGLESWCVSSLPPRYGFSVDKVLARDGAGGAGVLRRVLFGYGAALRFDVVHLYFGRSLLSFEDAPQLARRAFDEVRMARRLGRKVFMTLQGCEIRQAAPTHARAVAAGRPTACAPEACSAFEACVRTHDAERRALAERVFGLFDQVFLLNPDLRHFWPRGQFVPYASVDVDRLEPRPPRLQGPIRIAHAPSDRSIKGTRYVVDAVERLKARHDVVLDLVEGVTHAEALQRYAEADIVIDQLQVGWYGGFAVETLALGKPTLCYLDADDLQALPALMRQEMPIISARPQTLEADLEALIGRRPQWLDLSRRSAIFARRWHSPDAVAAGLSALYAGERETFDILPFLRTPAAIDGILS